MTYDDLLSWHEEGSPFFFLAEYQGRLCGYCYSRRVSFDLTLPHIELFLSRELVTGKGVSNIPNDSEGNAAYGISVTSAQKGSGMALTRAVHDAFDEHGTEYFVSFSRLSGLDDYIRECEKEMKRPLSLHTDDVALWYAHENARILKLRTWDMAKQKPNLDLPPLLKPDPVLGFHVRGTPYGILDILPNYMPDPASRDYGVLIVSAYPYR